MEIEQRLLELSTNTQNYNTVANLVLERLLDDKIITKDQFDEYSTKW